MRTTDLAGAISAPPAATLTTPELTVALIVALLALSAVGVFLRARQRRQ